MLETTRHQGSIKAKLHRITVIMMGSALTLVLFCMLAYEYLAARQALQSEIQAQADIVRENIASTLLFSDPNAAKDILSALRHSEQIDSAMIYLPDGTVFARYSRVAAHANAAAPAMPAHTGRTVGYSKMTLAESIHDPRSQKRQAIGTLYIETGLDSLYRSLFLFILATLVAGTISVLAARFLLVQLVRSIASPIQNLRNLMLRVSTDKNFTLRADVETVDEIGQLARGFNEMLHCIQVRDVELGNELERRKLAESRLARLAHFDDVTGLPNRNFFNEQLAFALSEAAQHEKLLCVMFIDLDNFKIVNDTLGHHIGDELLKETAHRLDSTIRPEDVVCRIGGDEFAIIMKTLANTDEVAELAQNIIHSLSTTFDLNGNEIFVGASIGYSFFPLDAQDASSLLRNADAAMYHAKERGKHNFQRFSEELENRARRRFMLENSLRRAIEGDEIKVYYQPLQAADSGSITGFEALVRWSHPELGIVAPAEFIQIAEDTGLIVPIGERVLGIACRQMQQWRQYSSRDLSISVNFSGRQFKEARVIDNILRILQESGLPPACLEVELTESTLMSNSAATLAKMELLREHGIRIAIDDFGTGYSSMNYLKRFPIHTLKIDQEFIREIPWDTDDITITRTIIAMAHALKLEVVAEGVETVEQLAVLRENRCDKVQGDLFSCPLPAEEAGQLLVRPARIMPHPALRGTAHG